MTLENGDKIKLGSRRFAVIDGDEVLFVEESYGLLHDREHTTSKVMGRGQLSKMTADQIDTLQRRKDRPWPATN